MVQWEDSMLQGAVKWFKGKIACFKEQLSDEGNIVCFKDQLSG